MTKFQKIVLGIVTGLVVVLFFSVANLKSNVSPSVGSVYNRVVQEFRAGLKAGTSNQLVISSTGGITTTGATSFGSITNGSYSYRPVITYTADTTLTVAQSGAIVQMGTAGLDITLPAPAVATGVNYRFLVSAAFATTDMTIVSGTADLISGSLIVAGAVVACDLADIITIAAANEDVGDFIDLYSDGVNWMIGANQAMTASNHACSG